MAKDICAATGERIAPCACGTLLRMNDPRIASQGPTPASALGRKGDARVLSFGGYSFGRPLFPRDLRIITRVFNDLLPRPWLLTQKRALHGQFSSSCRHCFPSLTF